MGSRRAITLGTVRPSLAILAVCLALFVITLPGALSAQPSRSATTESRDAGADTEDLVDPGSPRASMAQFVSLARQNRWPEAARFLDLTRAQSGDGARLAAELKEVIDRHFWLDPTALSSQPFGDPNDGLPPRTDEIGRVRGPSGTLEPIRISRRENSNGPKWSFTRQTVSRIDVWYDQLDARWARERLPAWLRAIGPRELLRWQWAALPVIALGALAVSRLFVSIALGLFTFFMRRRDGDFDPALPRGAAGPLSALLAIPFVHAAVAELGLYAPARSFVTGLLRAGLFVAIFWGLWRSVALLSQAVLESPWARTRPGSVTLVPLGARVLRIVIFALSVTAILSALGYPVASLLAGLGIGGLALALAAQKTGEHLFGSVAIGLDQPFRIGDYIKVEDFAGTVESVGLRSTRLRTVDRTVITIPNGKLADLRIENFSPRDRFHLYSTFGLAHDTPSTKLTAVLESLRAVLVDHPSRWPDELWVGVKELTTDAVVVEARVWFTVDSFEVFHALRTEVLLSLLSVIERSDVRLAYPARSVFITHQRGHGAPATGESGH